jgi:hypothetical protein
MREYKTEDLEKVRRALALLREARGLLVEAGADLAAGKVRRALRSTEGAERHMERLEGRAAAPSS